jgi:uncharacterized membrane protein YfcA
MPVYFFSDMSGILAAWPYIVAASLGAVIGTLWGVRLLRRIPERVFRRMLSVLIITLGVYMIIAGRR